MNAAVNLKAKIATFREPWVPKVVGELNGQYVKVLRALGAYDWHHHDDEDELFLVLEGHLDIELRDRTIGLEAGEFFIVPRGVEHRPVAEREAQVVLFEPATTRNTGNVTTAKTIEAQDLEQI